jgi:prepilin signal peptidase PulO-like enzyme (type II secretory pathway)
VPESWTPWLAAILGLALGSFLNVCTLRWPLDHSVVRPRSRCPHCGTPISGFDNVPVLSWLLLRGRCRACRAPISPQYPLVELTTALAWGGSVWLHGPGWEGLRTALFLTILLGIALSDARFYIIPDQFSLGGALLGFALAFAPAGLTWERSLTGAVGGYAAFWLVGVGGTWLVHKLNPQRLETAFQEHDEQRADERVRARVGRLRTPGAAAFLVGLALATGVWAVALGGTGAFLAATPAALAAVAVLLAWAEAFEDPIFTSEVQTSAEGEAGAPELAEEPEDDQPASALGGGDIRMMALVGAFVGLPGVLLTVLGGSALALVAALPLTLAFKQLIPLGIFLAFAAAGVQVFGEALLGWYLGLMGM